MRQLRRLLYRYGRFEDSKPEMGLTLIDGKYKAETLMSSRDTGRVYNMYIASCADSLYLVDAEKNEVVLNNNWELRETYTMNDCFYGDNFLIIIKLTNGQEKLSITTYSYDDFVNLVIGVSENCKDIEEAKYYLEEHGLHNSPDYPEIYKSTFVSPDFIHLNVHSHYSIMKSQITIPAAVDKAIANGMKGMALTDVGVMYGIKEFVDYCAKINKARAKEGLDPFKPIIGCEMYVAPRTMHDKGEGDDKCSRLIVLAKNLTGYKNLIKLVSDSWTEGLMNETPRTDFFELEKHHEGLIICSSCLNSVISARILSGDIEGARKAVVWFKRVWGEDFYMEILRHEVKDPIQRANRKVYPLQQRLNKVLVELAQEHNVKLVCSNNCYFVNEEDAEAMDRLHCLATDKGLDDPSRKLCTKQEWLKTREEMNEIFNDIPDAMSNTLEILDKVEFYSIENDILMPKYPTPSDFVSEADYLVHLTYQGAKKKYDETLPESVKERLDYELNAINSKSFPGYFLFVQDYVNAAQNELDVWIGPGRGSATGSLVNYCLGITKIDPLKHGLLFERFINPERVSLPDIDIDFDVDGRGKVLQWIRNKYGKDNCAYITTFGTFSPMYAVKEVARIEGLTSETADAVCQIIPDSRYPKDTLNNLLGSKKSDGTPKYPELVAALNSSDTKVANTIKYASQIEGTVCATGIHACGFIISPDAIANHAPISVADDPEFPDSMALVTQYDGQAIESTGLVKFDFLGLWTLSEIKESIRLIKQDRGVDIDIDNIPLDDEQTFKLYQEGQTIGTFLFESAGIQKYLRELKPTVFEDLVAMNALYRPGSLDYIPSLIASKNGREAIKYDLPVMEPYLKETYGLTVYQEQIMHLAREIAGFTRGESDALRKVLGKRHYVLREEFKEKFISGGMANGYNPDILERIWCSWEKFGAYAFNKSHAVAYTWLAYQTAYLKTNYPKEYMSALIQCRQYDDNEVTRLLEECKRMGIQSFLNL